MAFKVPPKIFGLPTPIVVMGGAGAAAWLYFHHRAATDTTASQDSPDFAPADSPGGGGGGGGGRHRRPPPRHRKHHKKKKHHKTPSATYDASFGTNISAFDLASVPAVEVGPWSLPHVPVPGAVTTSPSVFHLHPLRRDPKLRGPAPHRHVGAA